MNEIDDKTFCEALNRVAATDDGKIMLSCLKEYCLYDSDIVAGDMQDTYANAVLRRAYMYLRKRIESRHLKSIEFDYKRKVTKDGRERKRSIK